MDIAESYNRSIYGMKETIVPNARQPTLRVVITILALETIAYGPQRAQMACHKGRGRNGKGLTRKGSHSA